MASFHVEFVRYQELRAISVTQLYKGAPTPKSKGKKMLSLLFLFFGGVAFAGLMPDDDDQEPIGESETEFAKDEMIDVDRIFDEGLEPSSGNASEAGETESTFDIDVPAVLSDEELYDAAGLDSATSELSTELLIDDPLAFPSALTDWTNSDEIPVLSMGKGESLAFTFPEGDLGSLVVMDADYVEANFAEVGSSTIEHSGSNIYYVPEGETFPEHYEWSSTGGTLFNSSSYSNSESDFGNIKLIARIDCGAVSSEFDENEQLSSIVDNRIGDPIIMSSLKIVQI